MEHAAVTSSQQSPMETAFEMLCNGSAAAAVDLLLKLRAGHDFDASFQKQFSRLDATGKHALLRILVTQLQPQGGPSRLFPELWRALFQVSHDDYGIVMACLSRIQMRYDLAPWSVAIAAIGLMEEKFRPAAIRALGAVFRRFCGTNQVIPRQMWDKLSELAAGMGPALRATTYVAVASALPGELRSEDWETVINALLARSPEEVDVVRHFVETMLEGARGGWALDALITTASWRLYQQLLGSDTERVHLYTMLTDPGLSKFACCNFYDGSSGLRAAPYYGVPGFMRALVIAWANTWTPAAAVLADAGKEMIHLIIVQLMNAPDRPAHAIMGLVEALADVKYSDVSVWENAILLVDTLDPEDAAKAWPLVWQNFPVRYHTPELQRRFCGARLAGLARFRQMSAYMLAVKGCVGVQMWSDYLNLAKTLKPQELASVEDVGRLVFAPTVFGKPAPAPILGQFVDLYAGQAVLKPLLFEAVYYEHAETDPLLAILFDNTRRKLLTTYCSNQSDARRLVHKAAMSARNWDLLPPIEALIDPAHLAEFHISLVLDFHKTGLPFKHLWKKLLALVTCLPAAERAFASIAVSVALTEFALEFNYLAPPLHVDLRGRPTRAWLKALNSAIIPRDPSMNPYREAYRAALLAGTQSGLLGWDKVQSIAQYREALRKTAKLHWDGVFSGCDAEPMKGLRRTFCTTPRLEAVLQPWVQAICHTVRGMAACRGQLTPEVQKSFVAMLRPLLSALKGNKDQTIKTASIPEDSDVQTLLLRVFGPKSAPVVVDLHILDGITPRVSTAGAVILGHRRRLDPAVNDHVLMLCKLAAPYLHKEVEVLQDQHKALIHFIAQPGFMDQGDMFSMYTLDVLNKDKAEYLVLDKGLMAGDDVTPDQQFVGIVQRLAGPWLLVAARDEKGAVAAVAWCLLYPLPGGNDTALVCDSIDLNVNLRRVLGAGEESRLCDAGDATIAAIVAMLPGVAHALGASSTYLADQRHAPVGGWKVNGQPAKTEILPPPIDGVRASLFGVPFYTQWIGHPGTHYLQLG